MSRTDFYLNKDYGFDTDHEGLAILGLIGLVIFIIFIYPWLCFWLSYLGGWVAKITIGDQLVLALSHLNINVNKETIPLLAGGLGWVGGFFKSISTSKKG